jgi:hypothetical protein
MAERIRKRQYIGGIIVYILNRQGGTNFADFLRGSHHVAYSKSKFDAPIYCIGAVKAIHSILSPLCLFVETMPTNKAVASRNGNFKTKITRSNCK